MRFLLASTILTAAFACSDNVDPFVAAYENDASALSAYLEAGGDPDATDESGQSLLYVATGPKGGTAAVRTLLRHGADPNQGHYRQTPLMNASSWARIDDVRLLVEAGANPSLKNEQGQTALDTAGKAGGSERELVEYLSSL